MRKFLVGILLTTSLLTGCENEKKILVEDVILKEVIDMKDRESFVYVTFETKDGEEVTFTAHKAYLDRFYKGKMYDFYYTEKSFLRPDNEIVELNPFDFNPYKR